MSLSSEPLKSALAAYVPQPFEPQRSDDFSFHIGEGESLKGVWRVMRKRKLTIAVGGLCGFGLALLACLLMTKQYAATATIEVGKLDASQTSLLNNAAPMPSTDSDIKGDIATHMAVVQSPRVLLAVVKELNLQKEAPFAYKPTMLGWITGSNARVQDEIRRGLPIEQAPYTRERILKIFEKKLKVQNTPDTRLITLQYLNPNPQRAADIANAIVEEYASYEARSQATPGAQDWLTQQLSELKNHMDDSQNHLANFEQETGLNSMVLGSMGEGGAGGSTHVPALDSLDALNQQLTAAETDRIAKEAVYRLTRTKNPEVISSLAAPADASGSTPEIAVSDTALEFLRNLRQQQSALRLSIADMSTKYGANNQRLQEAKNQLESLDGQINAELARINETAHQSFLVASQKEAGIRSAFTRQQQKAGSLNVSAVQLQALSQEAAASRQLYDSLYSRLKEVRIQTALRATNIGMADPALAPAKAKRPNPPLYLAIGMIAGLFFGVSSAFVREHMDDTVSVGMQLGSGGRLPVLGNIPSSGKFGLLHSESGFISTTSESSPLINDPRSAASESFRALRAAIMVASRAGHLRSLLVTSPLSGEGRSTVAYNTAVAFAMAGKRVLLLDADMRKPRLHDLLGCASKPGLSDVLSGTAMLEGNIRQHPTVPTLFLLPAGSETTLPAELLSSSEFDELLSTLTKKYDLVIADSPPILMTTEARVLAEKFSATLAVIRAGQTTRTVLSNFNAVLDLSGSRAVGLVLNGVDTSSIDYFAAYGHSGKGGYLNV